MNKNGFFIKELEIRGSNVPTRSISFKKGLNVIFGTSDTGKTFIFQCIDYMLGSTKPPKSIPESKGYDFIRLVIETYKGDEHTLERDLREKNGDVRLIDKDSNVIRKLKLRNNSKSNKETISDFLLTICNILNKKIRKNAENKLMNLYFQELKRYFIVDEVNIIKEDSLLLSGQYQDKTLNKNVFRYLISGEDDSSIIEIKKDNLIDFKKGKVELYDELIRKLSKDLSDYELSNIDEEMERLNKTIQGYNEKHSEIEKRIIKYDNERKELTNEIYKQSDELMNTKKTLVRAELLKEQYNSDILRLQATLEFDYSLKGAEVKNCPVCDSSMGQIAEVNDLVLATKSEILKIKQLLNELQESYRLFDLEKNKIESDLKKNEDHLNNVISNSHNELQIFLNQVAEDIKILSDRKQELSSIITLRDTFNEYTQERERIAKLINRNSISKTDLKELTDSLLKPIINEMLKILNSINFNDSKNIELSFSEKDLDFVIGDKNRKEYGKGYRAILYTTFVIALLYFLRDRSYQIGTVIVDSPLNPYKGDEKKSYNEMEKNLADNFYNYLYDNIKYEQVILIENTPVPENIIEKINYKNFTRDNGFLPNLDR